MLLCLAYSGVIRNDGNVSYLSLGETIPPESPRVSLEKSNLGPSDLRAKEGTVS